MTVTVLDKASHSVIRDLNSKRKTLLNLGIKGKYQQIKMMGLKLDWK